MSDSIPTSNSDKAGTPESSAAGAELTLEKIYSALKNCFDPEIPINIVDLGLVYDVQIEEGNNVVVKMSLTTPGCGMGPSIAQDAKMKVLGLPGVMDARVDIVWEPAWGQHMISEEGRKKLGMA